MQDLETLGVVPGCVIMSIGAVMFDEVTGQLGETFYVTINRQSCIDAGLKEDLETVKWWEKQSPAAKLILEEVRMAGTPLKLALEHYSDWLAQTQYKDWIYIHDLSEDKSKIMDRLTMWGNGADFDNAILNYAYKAVGLPTPWAPFSARCYRTLKSLYRAVKLVRVGAHHNALDDAKTQARHAVALLRQVKPVAEQTLLERFVVGAKERLNWWFGV